MASIEGLSNLLSLLRVKLLCTISCRIMCVKLFKGLSQLLGNVLCITWIEMVRVWGNSVVLGTDCSHISRDVWGLQVLFLEVSRRGVCIKL